MSFRLVLGKTLLSITSENFIPYSGSPSLVQRVVTIKVYNFSRNMS
jgi:hypothetical protein